MGSSWLIRLTARPHWRSDAMESGQCGSRGARNQVREF